MWISNTFSRDAMLFPEPHPENHRLRSARGHQHGNCDPGFQSPTKCESFARISDRASHGSCLSTGKNSWGCFKN